MRKKGLLFDVVYAMPIDEWLMGDATRVNRILLNNAVKFTERVRIEKAYNARRA